MVLYVSVWCPCPHYHASSPFIIDDIKLRDIIIHDVNGIAQGPATAVKIG